MRLKVGNTSTVRGFTSLADVRSCLFFADKMKEYQSEITNLSEMRKEINAIPLLRNELKELEITTQELEEQLERERENHHILEEEKFQLMKTNSTLER